MRLEKGYHLESKDCLKQMRELPDESVDVIVTSPPYNLGVDYGTYRDNLTESDYCEWITTWLQESFRLMHDTGSLFLNVGASPTKPLLPYRIVLTATDRCGFRLQNAFHWIKSIAVREKHEYTTYGHFKPLNSNRFVNDCHEFIFHLTKSGNVAIDRESIGVRYEDKSCIIRFQRPADRRCRGNNWYIPYPTITKAEQEPHPASFPVELPLNCLRLHGCHKDTVVMDPFLGLGKSAVAAYLCGVETFVGCETNPQYLELARVALERAREGMFSAEDFAASQKVPDKPTDEELHPQMYLMPPEDEAERRPAS